MFEDAELIHRYSRAQAIADGVLIDVSEATKEAGFKFPVALTAAAWAQCVAVPPVWRARTRRGGCGTCCSCCTWRSRA
jgi:hypothetical protein